MYLCKKIKKNNMKYIIKILLIVLFFAIGNEFILTVDYIIGIFCYIASVAILVSLLVNISNWLDFKDMNFYDTSNCKVIDYKNHKQMFTIVPEVTTNDIIKDISKKNEIKKNISEIGDEIIVDEEEIEVDNTKSNKPIIHKSALIEEDKKPTLNKVTTVVKKEDKSIYKLKTNDKGTCIFVSNKELSKQQETVYRVLYKMFKKQNLQPNQLYALLQSIFYVDIFSSSVIIYVDKTLLDRAKLTEENLQIELVTKWVKKVLHDEELNVIFEEMSYNTLLNYYLSKQKTISDGKSNS